MAKIKKYLQNSSIIWCIIYLLNMASFSDISTVTGLVFAVCLVLLAIVIYILITSDGSTNTLIVGVACAAGVMLSGMAAGYMLCRNFNGISDPDAPAQIEFTG